MKKLNVTTRKRFELLKKFQKKWVALNVGESKILAFGNTTREVDKKLEKVKEKASIVEYVMPFDVLISPS